MVGTQLATTMQTDSGIYMGFKKHKGNAVPVSSWAAHIIHPAGLVCWPAQSIDPSGQVADKPCEDGRSTQTLTSGP